MAKLDVMPEQWIIDYYKGTIDFYEWNGIPCCRKWPVHRPRIRSEAELTNQQEFARATHLWNLLPAFIRAQHYRVAAHYRCTPRDIFIRIWFRGHRG